MTVALRRLDEALLPALLEAAVAGADPAEVMPPVTGEPGWTETDRAAFLAFHRARSIGTSDPVERTYAILDGDVVVGAGRLEAIDGGTEVGIWLCRRARGKGVGRAAVAQLIEQALRDGETRVVAETTSVNTAAVGALRALGAVLTEENGAVHAVLTFEAEG